MSLSSQPPTCTHTRGPRVRVRVCDYLTMISPNPKSLRHSIYALAIICLIFVIIITLVDIIMRLQTRTRLQRWRRHMDGDARHYHRRHQHQHTSFFILFKRICDVQVDKILQRLCRRIIKLSNMPRTGNSMLSLLLLLVCPPSRDSNRPPNSAPFHRFAPILQYTFFIFKLRINFHIDQNL